MLNSLCIYVKSLDEYINIQLYLFSKGHQWNGNGDKLFEEWSDHSKIEFPRNIIISSSGDIYNVFIGKDNQYGYKIVTAESLLRKYKLKKLNKINDKM